MFSLFRQKRSVQFSEVTRRMILLDNASMAMRENRGEKIDLALSSLLTVLVFVLRLIRENPCQIAQTSLVRLNNSNSVQKTNLTCLPP